MFSKVLIIASLAVASIVLHGCGGGGSSDNASCKVGQDYGDMACMSIEVPNVDSGCCSVMNGLIPDSITSPPACGTPDNCSQQVCSKCKGQGTQSMKDVLANCSAPLPVISQAKHAPSERHFASHPWSQPVHFESHKKLMTLRASGNSACGTSANECKLPVPAAGGVTANLVLKSVSAACCGTIGAFAQDLWMLAQKMANGTMPSPSDLPVKDIEGLCTSCAHEGNELLSGLVMALKAAAPGMCNATSAAAKHLTV